MNSTDFLLARSALIANDARLAALIESQRDMGIPLGRGSRWTIGDVPVHLAVGINLYAEFATGIASPYDSLAVDACAAQTQALMDDVRIGEPDRLVALMRQATATFLENTEGQPGDRPAPWHCATTLDIATLTALAVAEQILHGFDLATALHAPWPIQPGQAVLALEACAPLLGLIRNPSNVAEHTAAYTLHLTDGPALTVHFKDGELSLGPPGDAADCTITADPVAFLLVFTGRMSRFDAIAANQISLSGPRPDLGVGFFDLFAFP